MAGRIGRSGRLVTGALALAVMAAIFVAVVNLLVMVHKAKADEIPGWVSPCYAKDDVLQKLESSDYALRSFGDRLDGGAVEVFVDPAGNFIVATQPAPGVACLLVEGDGWADVLPKRTRLPRR